MGKSGEGENEGTTLYVNIEGPTNVLEELTQGTKVRLEGCLRRCRSPVSIKNFIRFLVQIEDGLEE